MASSVLVGVSALIAAAPSSSSCRSSLSSRPWRMPTLRLRAQPVDQDYIAYEGDKSVFPAEACDELGGDNCLMEGVGAEVKSTVRKPTATAGSTSFPKVQDRQYLDYKEDKTVFPDQACDEFGGEFCEPEYQKGVYREVK